MNVVKDSQHSEEDITAEFVDKFFVQNVAVMKFQEKLWAALVTHKHHLKLKIDIVKYF
jgi:hypothetical protein